MDNSIEEPIVAVSDPGEVDRASHSLGDRAIIHISNLFAWLFPILMIAICSQVVLRQMGNNQAWLDDMQWWLYGAAVLVAIGYAVTTNSHVRVDIRYDNFTEAKKARTDVFALAWLFLPFIILSWDITFHYAFSSVKAWEGSDSPNGLHNLWFLKVFMNLTFIFIGAATWFAYVRRLSVLCEPVLWKKLLYAFPSIVFLLDLLIYYSAFWIIYVFSEDKNLRQVGRSDFFDEIEWGNFETAPAVAYAIVAAVIVIVVARAMAGRKEA